MHFSGLTYRIAFSFRQRKVKGGSFVQLGFGPDTPAVARDDSLNDGEADTSAFEFLLVVQSLKNAEQSIRIAHFKPRSIVANKINSFLIVLLAADFHQRAGLVAGEFERIGQQVNKNLFK